MKLENIKYKIIGLILLIIGISSCTEEFLEVEPKGTALEENYYSNEREAYAGLVAVYDRLGKYSSSFENMVTMMNAGSDDHFAGGGNATDGTGIQSFSDYSISESTIPRSFWSDYYQGIFRANILLIKLPDVPMPEATKKRFIAETKTLRAYYYFELVRMFRNIPLILAPIAPSDIFNIPQVNPEEVYLQIENDLKESMSDLPNTIANLESEGGRLTKGAAQALLGKVYLYEGKNTEAAAELAVVNGTPGGTSMYGYKLAENFADLWANDDEFNAEGIIEINHTNTANVTWDNWGGGENEGNNVNTMVGPRSIEIPEGSTIPAYVSGWSFNTITQNLFDAYSENDVRFEETIVDFKTLQEEGKVKYIPGYKDTGYFLKKFMPVKADVTTGGGEAILNYTQNMYPIRLADTYLLEAEALGGSGTRAQALLDAIRKRAGLASVPVSLETIANERRLELAGEGHRWFDLVRTGRAATILADRGFTAGKNEIFPIPLKELENTLIEQNPNY